MGGDQPVINCDVKSETSHHDKFTKGDLLLILNKNCLEIFEREDDSCFTNLKKLDELRHNVDEFSAQKYKQMRMLVMKVNNSCNPLTKVELKDILSDMGEQILSVKMYEGNSLILQLISENCKNLTSIELWNCSGSNQLQDFRNLIELKLPQNRLCVNAFKKCLANNPDIESLGCDGWWFEEELGDFLKMLPKIKSLRLYNLDHSFHQNEHFRRLYGLTKFSFKSEKNCDTLLAKLAENTNLVELNIEMPLRVNTFNLMKLFPNLEVLYMAHIIKVKPFPFPESTTFPSKIKCIHINKISISCNALLSTVKELKFLAEFYLGSAGAYKCKFLCQNYILYAHVYYFLS